MKSYYSRLALTGVKSNRQLYLPFLLTSAITVAMYYIIDYLSVSDIVLSIRGGRTIAAMMTLGSYVMVLFAVIFLFYTHSFLIRRRKKELGLYNVLGMGKKHIAKIMTLETLLLYIVSVVAGLCIGILLSKLSELGLVAIMQGQTTFDFTISVTSVIKSLAVFAVIFLLILTGTLVQVGKATASKLLKSEQSGEKPPKANYVLGILGILLLGGAYYLACSVDNPFDALILFFVAVLMVIVATYMLMICGSVMLCKLLQKCKGYYYDKKHFVSVSLMKYRMKRGGAGLASICVLATMVLVMISSTSCLYYGAEDSLNTRYPHDIKIQLNFASQDEMQSKADECKALSDKTAVKYGAVLGDSLEIRMTCTAGLLKGDYIYIEQARYDGTYDYSELREIFFMTASDYARATGRKITVPDGKAALIYCQNAYQYDTINFEGGVRFELCSVTNDDMSVINGVANTAADVIYVILPSAEPLSLFDGELYQNNFNPLFIYSFDTGSEFDGDGYMNEYEMLLRSKCKTFYYATKEGNAEDFYGTYGGLFYLGILLSIVFVIAAVLIIYYKQLSEGYEDAGKFEVMQNVGMTKTDIKKSINSQLITVFFAPLALSGLHLTFAFPMVRRLLALFALNNIWLFVLTNVISFVVFGVCYTIVYKLTSNAYYRIVSKV